MSDPPHASTYFIPDRYGWWPATCTCGWSAGAVYPTAGNACDALMDHAYEAGVRTVMGYALAAYSAAAGKEAE